MLAPFPRRPSLTLVGAVALVIAIANPAAAPPGDLDTTFGGDGKVTTDFPGAIDEAFAVAIQGDGRIVAAGRTLVSGTSDFALARYNTDGSLDTTFSGDGLVTTDFNSFNDEAFAVAIQGDGKIVAAGSANVSGTSEANEFALARYNTDGSLDTTFSGDGKVTTDFPGAIDEARAVAIQGDGKIVAAGRIFSSGDSGFSDFALARYNTDGSLDTTFSGDGKVTTDFAGDNDQARAVAIQGDGRIVVAGFARVNSIVVFDFALARYNTNGSLDRIFSGGGKVTTDFDGDIDEAYGVAIQGNGRIVAVGLARVNSIVVFALARYNTDGSLDTTFDGDGKVTTDIAGGSDRARGVDLQGDGKIVAAGDAGPDFALARYNTGGSLDTTFGGDGKVTTDFAGSLDEALAVDLQGDGKIVAAGVANISGSDDFALARYKIQDAADLALTKTDPPGRVPTGRDMTYTLTVTNNGPDAASGVIVTDQLPPSVTFVSATPSQGSCSHSSGTVTCNLGTMGNGATATVDIVVKPTVAGTITNTASVTSSTPDTNQGNNSDSENTSVCRITSRRSSIPCG